MANAAESYLLQHQQDALKALVKWFDEDKTKQQVASIILPTGTGKSYILLLAPYYLKSKRTLIITPAKVITEQLKETFNGKKGKGNGLTDSFFANFVPHQYLEKCIPAARVIEEVKELSTEVLLSECIITNAHKMQPRWIRDNLTDWMNELKEGDLVLIDEAHHFPAESWLTIIKFFTQSKIVFFTATPYRSNKDEKVLSTGPTFFYTRKRSVELGIIRDILFESVSSKDCKDDQDAWMVILSTIRECIDARNKSPFTNGKHQCIAYVNEKGSADKIKDLAKLFNITAGVHHGDYMYDRKGFDAGSTELLIVCGMLLEGYDNPRISVCAIMSNMKSGIRFSQFVGRAIRLNRKGGETKEDPVFAQLITNDRFNLRSLFDDYYYDKLVVQSMDDASKDSE
jgi:superfamily II DNA or RNA helicase